MRISETSIGEFELKAVEAVLRSGWLTQGEQVQAFEELFAERLGLQPENVVACSSGTAALHLALRAAGVGPGDEVLVPDLTYVATANAVAYCGATPVLVDVDPTTWCIDLLAAEAARTPRTKAIVPVHLYGVPADMKELVEFGDQFHVTVIEDAAQGLGGSYRGTPCGALGGLATFSFYANKIITMGEGGAVVTRSHALATEARFLRGQAQAPGMRFYHTAVGFNYRLTDLQAAVGLAQLRRFRSLLKTRQMVVDAYARKLPKRVLTPMFLGHGDRLVAPWLATIELADATEARRVAAQLAEVDVETRPIFVPLHALPMYAADPVAFPNARRIFERGLSLPTHGQVDVSYVCDVVTQALGEY